ncbi:MAG: thiamine diphosphokinase [Clostridia bacterium]|nr:thiamine diphosphokinase [Clostridia bacterium]
MGESMRRAVIVGSAPFSDASLLAAYLCDDDELIAADGGQHLVAAMGRTPSLLVGDFDSSCCPMDVSYECRVLPVQKDDTDVLAAIRIALENGTRRFLFLGCLGGRLDHTIANLFLLRFLYDRGAEGVLVDETHEITLLGPGVHVLEPRDGRVLSLLPYGGDAVGVSIEGALYTLQNARLDTAFPIGVSNAFCGKPITVTIEDGFLLCILA